MEIKITLNSKRAYPLKKYEKNYIDSIENIEDRDVRILLKLILCSGFRIGEVLNSYLYYEGDQLHIRAVAEKRKRLTGHKMFRRGFLGETYLNNQIKAGRPIFKSRPLINLFSLNVAELYDLASTFEEPEWIGKNMPSYYQLRKRLKECLSIEVLYYYSPLETPRKITFNPSFHFFRKLFSAEHSNVFRRDAKTIEYMAWENPSMLYKYVKEYIGDELEEKEPTTNPKTLILTKKHDEDPKDLKNYCIK